MQRFIALLMSLALFSCTAPSVEPTPEAPPPSIDPATIQVMVLGTYHMAGSDADVINVEVDSVLTDRRQKELAELADALASFQPNVVVTERVTAAPDYVDPHFADYSEALLAEVANERVQVAMRLAHRAGVIRVYGLDEQPEDGEPDYFPFGKLMAHTEATGTAEVLQAQIAETQEMVEEFMQSTADDHIASRLLAMNTGPMSSADFYYRLSDFDQGETQPAAELQAYWFMRNAKIWSKLMDVTQPGDRVVIVYGAGHKFWLEHFADHTPGFLKIDPAPFLEIAADTLPRPRASAPASAASR